MIQKKINLFLIAFRATLVSNLANSLPRQICIPTLNDITLLPSLLISKILDKYPDFDPNWSPDVQKSWMEGMIKLYDGIN